MDQLPITFTHNEKEYSGYFHSVAGAGETQVFHLMVDNFFFGKLRRTDRWVFDSTPKMDLSEMADFFGEYIVAWYQ